MRTADLCSTCPTFTNALCVLYNGTALPNTLIQPLDALSVALTKIDSNLVPLSGVAAPTNNARYVGQQYINTITSTLYYAVTVGNGAADWVTVQNTTIIDGAHGGTGVANTGKTITLGGNFITTGSYPLTLELTDTTSVALPTSGTLATLSNAETLTNKTLSAPSITGGTIASPTITSPTISNGTFSSPTISTPTITSPTISSPTITGGGTINGTDATVLQVTTNLSSSISSDSGSVTKYPSVNSTQNYVTGYAQTLANISNNVVTDAASTTKYPSVNSIKGYVDQFTLTSTATINLTVANTVLSHSFTGVASVTSPGSLAVPTSPVSGIKYIVWNLGVSAGVTINTTDGTVFYGQGGFTPSLSFIIPYLSIFSFTFINGAGWIIADLTISDSNLVITAATIGTSGYIPIRGITQVTSVGSGGFVQLPSGANAYGEFIIWNATGGTLNVAPTSPEITFGPRGTSSTTPVSMATATYYSFKYVFGASGTSTGGWFVTALS